MELLADEGKDSASSNPEKKGKIESGLSKVNSITSYFQRKILSGNNKSIPTQHRSVSSQVDTYHVNEDVKLDNTTSNGSNKDKPSIMILNDSIDEKNTVTAINNGTHSDGSHGDDSNSDGNHSDSDDDGNHGDGSHSDDENHSSEGNAERQLREDMDNSVLEIPSSTVVDSNTTGCHGDHGTILEKRCDDTKDSKINSTSRKEKNLTELSKSKWSLTWKAKKKPPKKTTSYSDSDSDEIVVDNKQDSSKRKKPAPTKRKKHVQVKNENPVLGKLGKPVLIAHEKPASVEPNNPVSLDPEKAVSVQPEISVMKPEELVHIKKSDLVDCINLPDATSDTKSNVFLVLKNTHDKTTSEKARTKKGILNSRELECKSDNTSLVSSLEGTCLKDGLGQESTSEKSTKSIFNPKETNKDSVTDKQVILKNVHVEFPHDKKSQKVGKSAFDLLMKNSRDKASMKMRVSGNEDNGFEAKSTESSSGKESKSPEKSKNVKARKRSSKKSIQKSAISSLGKTDNEVEDISNGKDILGAKHTDVSQKERHDKAMGDEEKMDGKRKTRKRKAGSDGNGKSARQSGKSDNDDLVDSPVKKVKSKKRKRLSLQDSDVECVEEEEMNDDDCKLNTIEADCDPKKQNKRERRCLRKRQQNTQSDHEIEEQSTSTTVHIEKKTSNVKKSHCAEKEKSSPLKVGPIAPIFLPGAWRRGKQKMDEEEQLQNSNVDLDDVNDNVDLVTNSQSSVITIADKTLDEETIKPYSPIKDTGERLQAFMGLFKPPAVKCTVVIKHIAAPFPKVSHVRQIGDDMKQKWNLAIVSHRFVNEEFFNPIDAKLSPFCGFLDIELSELTVNWKGFQVLPVPKLSDVQSQFVIKYLKTVYYSYPVRKLFKRCRLQLQRCKQAELENINTERHSAITRFFQQQPSSKVAQMNTGTDQDKPLLATIFHDTEKPKPFTKISKKNIPKKGKKLTKVSPLLMAFQKQSEGTPPINQENTPRNSKKNERKKQTTRKTSLRDYLNVPAKNSESISDDLAATPAGTKSKKNESLSCTVQKGKNSKKNVKAPGTLATSKRDRKSKKKENNPGNSVPKEEPEKFKKISPFTEKGSRKSTRSKREQNVNILEKENAKENSKKRERDAIEVDKIDGPSKKKAKLLSDAEAFKQPRRGRSRKDNKRNVSENVEVSEETAYTKTKAIAVTSKSPKISSDEDFVTTSKVCERLKTKRKGAKVAIEVDENPNECRRKSSRLRKKLAVEEVDKESLGERFVNNNESVVELREVMTSEKEGKIETKCNHETETKNETGIKNAAQMENEMEHKKGIGDETITEVKNETAIPCISVADGGSLAADAHATNSSEGVACEERARDVGDHGPSVLWTECFKPADSDEILGNSSGGNKLKNWLKEWRSLREKRLSKIRRHKERKRKIMPETVKCDSTEWWYEDDSDFDMSDGSDDSYCDEEDTLCNTMLITGPTGCGKTSAVYACAKELGLKVIEVNSSTKRGGKYILSELQEATQSHRVSRKRHEKESVFSSSTCENKVESKSEKVSEKKRSKKSGKMKKKEDVEKKKNDEITSPSAETVHVKMSLILLDEVDVIFEEDKGFWAAVNSLRQNSKRPIVMTASDCVGTIDGIFEHITLKAPQAKLHAAYLQTVCLSKNVFTNPNDTQTLAVLHNGDVRKSLLSLQFWIDSNAGACDPEGYDGDISGLGVCNSVVCIPQVSPQDTVKCDLEMVGSGERDSQESNEVGCGKMDVEMTVKEHEKEIDLEPSRLMVVELDQSNQIHDPSRNLETNNCLTKQSTKMEEENVGSNLPKKSVTETSQKNNEVVPSTSSTNSVSDLVCPLDQAVQSSIEEHQGGDNGCNMDVGDKVGEQVDTSGSKTVHCVMHEFCLESLLGLRNVASKIRGAMKVLSCVGNKNGVKYSFGYKCSVTSHCQGLGIDVVRCNLATLLPCLFACIHGIEDTDEELKNTKMIPQEDTTNNENFEKNSSEDFPECTSTVNTSVFDDEADDNMTATAEVFDTRMGASNESIESKVENKKEVKEGAHKKLANISLDVYSECLENMSFLDSVLHSHYDNTDKEQFGNWYARIRPGLEDTTETCSLQSSWKSRAALNEIRGALEVASLECSHQHFHNSIEKASLESDVFHGLSSDISLGSGLCEECKERSRVEVDIVGLCSRSEDPKADTMGYDEKVMRGIQPKQTIKITSDELSKTQRKRAEDFDVIAMYLPDYHQLNRSSFALDYIPTLRNICQNELLRQTSRTKRRFYHYFDSVGLNLPQSTTQLLTDDTFA